MAKYIPNIHGTVTGYEVWHEKGTYRVRYLPVKYKHLVENKFGNFHKSGSITGMKNKYYGKDALLVRCGSYIYNVTSEPRIYWEYAY